MSETSDPRHTSDAGRRMRIVVAMSGGVDSSVAAALLKEAGHDVIGITLQLYDHGQATGRKGSCCAGQDIHDARRVAAALSIPHYVLDYESRFRDSVMTDFAASYLAGETPIPCVTCNSRVKFRDLFATARDLGADRMATGHYIDRQEGAHGATLHRAADGDRDQSYFLFATTREQLAQLMFPLGGLAKDEVRAHARRFNLPVATKPDSQDICFVPNGRYTDVIERLRPGAAEAGDIVHVDGRVLGRHQGIMHFTVGQRRGLGIASPDPLFVVRIDASQRRVVVGPREHLAVGELTLREVNWLGDDAIGDLAHDGLAIHVRLRSSQPLQPATLVVRAGTVQVLLDHREFGVAKGQAAVFYADSGARARVLGGGIIAATSGIAAATMPQVEVTHSTGLARAILDEVR